MSVVFEIRPDDLRGPQIAALLAAHLDDMRATSPPESVHALDLDGLRVPEVSFWAVWAGAALAGCGAMKALGGGEGEIKSMRTAPAFRRRGVAALMLHHLIDEGRARGYACLRLETGSMAFFAPARQLYARFGFRETGPFAAYRDDPNSVFMALDL
ncbi:MAG TPA: GNAT family N-acetyltransferase [Pseudomonadales bacterium]|nr:GNAT family N-acetyltransferase [Pseudomonadales bacterium]